MKQNISKFLFFSVCLLTSCSGDVNSRKVFLSTGYKLVYAVYIKGYEVDTTAYLKGKKFDENYIEFFDVENSKVEMRVDGTPRGYGSFRLTAKENKFEQMNFEFEYYCQYTNNDGGKVYFTNVTSGVKPDAINVVMYRSPDWWVRMDIHIPEITDKKIILEFQKYVSYDVPEEFNHKIW